MKTKYYLHDIGSGRVREVLNVAASEHCENIAEHPQMSCIRGNSQVEMLDLYEVSERVKDKMILQKEKDGLAFIVFAQAEGDDMPREQSFQAATIIQHPATKQKPVRAAARRTSRSASRSASAA